MNKNSRRSVFLFFWLSLVAILFGCSTSKTEVDLKLDKEYLNVCDIMTNISSYEGTTVKVKGQIKGFHQIVLYDDKCSDDVSLILLDLGYSDFSAYRANEIVDLTKPNEIDGRVLLEGKIEKEKGRLIDYGEFVFDPKANKTIGTPRDISVHRMSQVKINSYIPK